MKICPPLPKIANVKICPPLPKTADIKEGRGGRVVILASSPEENAKTLSGKSICVFLRVKR